ncbi:hypothetical protein EW146_g674 [Bondarzewia mesenterica]|uniref:Endonuclease/exonuclease/phosphatase domain-containing protein n=1 Tax=Bondarzewia mesenterica TaxID=1095465 RepID=A0A4S4M859_9AGAM|nr:hypothetical protein EW146_g674 [Bondarzewia mesenterica]
MIDKLRDIPTVRWSRSRQAWAHARSGPSAYAPESIALLTWNLQFETPYAWERHTAALTHIQHKAFGCYEGQAPRPAVVMLQEVCAEAFGALLAHTWVRAHFKVAPPSPHYWPDGSRYGVVTLVSRHMSVGGVTSLEYGGSEMGRNLLMVDIWVNASRDRKEYEPRIVRVANTHLESLSRGASCRTYQMQTVGQWLKDNQVLGGVVCGDMNATEPSDEAQVKFNGLVDAWDSHPASKSKDADGTTWGYQPQTRYRPTRLDKVLYVKKPAYSVERPWTIGIGLQTRGGQWVSDHYGLMSELRILGE